MLPIQKLKAAWRLLKSPSRNAGIVGGHTACMAIELEA